MSIALMKERLPISTKVLYGVAEFGISMMTSALQFFLIYFYTDVMNYNPAIVGSALLVGKLSWDLVNDPLFGYFSDRVSTRIGRRRPFMLLGAVPLGISIWILFSVPANLNNTLVFLVVIGTFLLFDTFHTIVSVPYFAMTPELSYDYDERTSITAVRKIFGVLGYIAGAVLTTLVAGIYRDSFGFAEREAFSAMGVTFGIIVTITVLITALTVKEKPIVDFKPSEIPLIKSILLTFQNRPFVRLMVAFLVSSFSFTVMTGLFIYYMKYYLYMEKQFSLVLLVMMGTLALFLFFWKWVADRLNKGPAYALGLFIACVAISTTFFLPPSPTPLIYVIAFFVGFGFSSQYVFPWSMLPDCVEHDQIKTGERREGIYFGVWALVVKLTSALGVAVIGWSLALFNFAAPINGEMVAQGEDVLLGIRLLFGPIPAILMILSLPLLVWFPITRKSHNILLSELEVKQKQ